MPDDSPPITTEIHGTGAMNRSRRLTLTRGQPGRICLTIIPKGRPVTICVSVAELRAALERLVPNSANAG